MGVYAFAVAQGNLSVTEYKEAMEAIVTNPEDSAEDEDAVKVKRWLVNQSIRLARVVSHTLEAGGTEYITVSTLHERITLGKGVLFPEERGLQPICYNPGLGTHLVTIAGIITLEGVWLGS